MLIIRFFEVVRANPKEHPPIRGRDTQGMITIVNYHVASVMEQGDLDNVRRYIRAIIDL